jgi:hypothetical protein
VPERVRNHFFSYPVVVVDNPAQDQPP